MPLQLQLYKMRNISKEVIHLKVPFHLSLLISIVDTVRHMKVVTINNSLPLRLQTHMKMMAVAIPVMRRIIIIDARVPITALGDSTCLLLLVSGILCIELTYNILCRWRRWRG